MFEEIDLILLIKNRSLFENKIKKNDNIVIEITVVFLNTLEYWKKLTLNLGAIKWSNQTQKHHSI